MFKGWRIKRLRRKLKETRARIKSIERMFYVDGNWDRTVALLHPHYDRRDKIYHKLAKLQDHYRWPPGRELRRG